MKDKGSVSKIIAVLSALLVVSIVIGCFTLKNDRTETPESESVSEQFTKDTTEKESTSEEKKTDDTLTENEKTSESTSETPTKSYASYFVEGKPYVNGILVVNKSYALPEDYNPGVDPEAQSALDEMSAAASEDGISLWVQSGFRSYSYQSQLYENYAAQDGYAEADRYSARPGHSEHQTGLAFDLNSLSTSFGETAEGKWLAANCWKYGFIIRYPQGKESVTGYMYEPWHVRYLGKDTAKAVYDSGLCLEEYLGITSEYAD